MEYITCPTCGYFLGQKSIEYNEKKEKICTNKDNTPEMISDKMALVMKNLKIRRYCCRMRLMSCKDLSKEIISPIN